MNILYTILVCMGMTSKVSPGPKLGLTPGVENILLISGPEVVLNLKSTLISGNTIKIGYEIPYPGYIEFSLYEKSGEQLWYNAYVKEKGEHFLAFKREKLQTGVSYNYTFQYKGKNYPGSFVNN